MRRLNQNRVGNGWAIVGVLAALLVMVGCAAGQFDGDDECTDSSDCKLNQQCVNGTCSVFDVSGNDPDTSGPTDSYTPKRDGGGADSAVDDGGGQDPDGMSGKMDAADTSPGTDVGNDTGKADSGDSGSQNCGGNCKIGQKCENGQCVSKCQPNCNSQQQCADLGEGPKCYSTCQQELTTKGCTGSGVMCRDINRDPNSQKKTLVCLQSQCSKHSECQSGTCLQFHNSYGTCVRKGPKKVGQSCDLSKQSGLCESGAFCVRSSSSSMTGTCRKLCDPWSASPSCNSNQRCSLFKRGASSYIVLTFRQGFCNNSVDAVGSATLDSCQSDQNMCDHGIRCVGSTDPLCMKWCRPGKGDCTGEIPSQYMASGVCNNYVFPGERNIGRCVPRCSGTRYCSQMGYGCTNGLCRNQCSSATVVQDCCDGNQPCDWKCNNGLCE